MLTKSGRVKAAASKHKVQAEEKEGRREEKQSGLEIGKKRKGWIREGWMLLGAASFYPYCLSAP